ncbi:hypothetical protein GCM10009676_23920 [Prauserella halophila]|uniref:Uncharacterized protein n=1 Tax=Prauserella halophila TaxID=185641 RepID=A0ABN1WB35_9PSEU|nr:hypothetical protein [Prauserella halophila]MCP2235422.1 hypothetical protein [Prauserella halophila]
MWKRTVPAAALGMLLLAGCSEVAEVQDTVSGAADKASVCGKALGIVDLNPNLDPQQAQDEAADKAQQLRDLAGQAAEQDLQQNLTALADGYVELEQRSADQLGEFNQWLQQNLNNLESLRQACM